MHHQFINHQIINLKNHHHPYNHHVYCSESGLECRNLPEAERSWRGAQTFLSSFVCKQWGSWWRGACKTAGSARYANFSFSGSKQNTLFQRFDTKQPHTLELLQCLLTFFNSQLHINAVKCKPVIITLCKGKHPTKKNLWIFPKPVDPPPLPRYFYE